jgi:hypothetical protein
MVVGWFLAFLTILHPTEFSELKGILSKLSGIDEENIMYTKVGELWGCSIDF